MVPISSFAGHSMSISQSTLSSILISSESSDPSSTWKKETKTPCSVGGQQCREPQHMPSSHLTMRRQSNVWYNWAIKSLIWIYLRSRLALARQHFMLQLRMVMWNQYAFSYNCKLLTLISATIPGHFWKWGYSRIFYNEPNLSLIAWFILSVSEVLGRKGYSWISCNYHKLMKMCSPPFCTLLWGKVGRGICLIIQAYAPCFLVRVSQSWCTAVAFWKNGNFTECVLQEISSACVNITLSGIEATYIVSGDRGRPWISLYCKQQKPIQ